MSSFSFDIESALSSLDLRLNALMVTGAAIDYEQLIKGCMGIRSFVEREVFLADASQEDLVHFVDGLTTRVFAMIQHTHVATQIKAICVLRAMIEVKCDVALWENLFIKFYNCLQHVFRMVNSSSSNDTTIVEMAAKALGHLVRQNRTALGNELVDFQVTQSLEWLRNSKSNKMYRRRLVAVLILKELSENAPILFNVHVKSFLEHIWWPLRDPIEKIRQAAVDALRACLVDLSTRGSRWKFECYQKLFLEAQKVFMMHQPDINNIHGSLLVLGELLQHTGEFMWSRFKEVCETIFRYIDHKDALVSRTVILLFPKLAALVPEAFRRGYADRAIGHVLLQLEKTSANCSAAFIVLGEIAVSIPEAILPHQDRIISIIHSVLLTGISSTSFQPSKPRNNSAKLTGFAQSQAYHLQKYNTQSIHTMPVTHAALACIGLLAAALHEKLTPNKLTQLIGLMFETGLSRALIDALTDVTTHIPHLLPMAQERLLQVLTETLTGGGKSSLKSLDSSRNSGKSSTDNNNRKSRHAASKSLNGGSLAQVKENNSMSFGADSSSFFQRPFETHNSTFTMNDHPHINISSESISSMESKITPSDDIKKGNSGLVLLALSTLLSFDWTGQGQYVISLARYCIISYLEHNRAAIRKEAALVCFRLTSIGGSCTHHYIESMMFHVLRRLVMVCATDSAMSVRLVVLNGLYERVVEQQDTLLAQQQIIDVLLLVIKDEHFEIRLKVIHILGHLSNVNPAAVLPAMRSKLSKLLADLENPINGDKQAEQDTRLLGALIDSCSELVRPFVVPIFTILVPQLTLSLAHRSTKLSSSEAAAKLSQSGGEATRLFQAQQNNIDVPVLETTTTEKVTLPLAPPSDSKTLPILKKPTRMVASCVLSTLGKLSAIAGEEILPYFDALVPLIIEALQDQTSSDRQLVALRTLQQLISSTGYVIKPAIKHRSLLPTLLYILRCSRSVELRMHVLKSLGVLGALDPLRFQDSDSVSLFKNKDPKVNLHIGESRMDKSEENDDMKGQETDYDTLIVKNSDAYYRRIALSSLIKVFRDSNLADLHPLVIKALMFIFRSLQMKVIPFLPEILPFFLEKIQSSDASLCESYLQNLRVIISVIKQHVLSYLEQIVDVIIFLWSRHELVSPLLSIVEELSVILQDQFKPYLDILLPKLLADFHHQDEESQKTIRRILLCIRRLSSVKGNLDDPIQIIMPSLLRLCEHEEKGVALRVFCVGTIKYVINHHNAAPFLVPMIQTLSRALNLPFLELQIEVLSVLCVLVKRIGFEFVPFENQISKIIFSSASLSSNKKRHSLAECKYFHIYRSRIEKMYVRLADSRHMYTMLYPNPFVPNQQNRDDNSTFTFEYKDNEYHTLTGEDLEGSDVDDMQEGVDNSNLNSGFDDSLQVNTSGSSKTLHVSEPNIMKAWSAAQRSTSQDWISWMKTFSLELLRESPSYSLRACSILAQRYAPLARSLFNAAFLSCWCALFDQYQESLIHSLEMTFRSPCMPPEIVQTLLNLAEFMEHHDTALPIADHVLGDLAYQCQAYAKALYYKEKQFLESPSATVEVLISTNNRLQQSDAARGVLKIAQKEVTLIKELWYEQLGRWEEALVAYETKCREDRHNFSLVLGRMRCLRSMGEWEKVVDLGEELWENLDVEEEDAKTIREEAASLLCHSHCQLGRWDDLAMHVSALERKSFDFHFYQAIRLVHQEDFQLAQNHISTAYRMLASNLTTLLAESYSSSYPLIVKAQQLTELNEVIALKSLGSLIIKEEPAEGMPGMDQTNILTNRDKIQTMWSKRLEGNKEDADVWMSVLMIRSLIDKPRDNIDVWLKFVTLCRKSGRKRTALGVLTNLTGIDPMRYLENPSMSLVIDSNYPEMAYAKIVNLHACGHVDESIVRMQEFVSHKVFDVQEHSENSSPDGKHSFPTRRHLTRSNSSPKNLQLSTVTRSSTSPMLSTHSKSDMPPLSPSKSNAIKSLNVVGGKGIFSSFPSTELNQLKSRGYLKLGVWKLAMLETNNGLHLDAKNQQSVTNVLECFYLSCRYNKESFRSWEEWAVMNFQLAQMWKARALPPAMTGSINTNPYIVPALQGFCKAVLLQNNRDHTIQDLLRLLALYFEHGHHAEVEDSFLEGVNVLGVDMWLAVIPQMIARLDAYKLTVRKVLHQLFCKIGRAHPQALVYPLTVATKSDSKDRKQAALNVLNNMKQHSPVLVEQVKMVSTELVRVAVLWIEQCHKAIESASRHWFGNKNFKGMYDTFEPLHTMLEKGARTIQDRRFEEMFGRDLNEAWHWCKKYDKYREISNLNRAWDIYLSVFRKVSKMSTSMVELELQAVSPKLLAARDLELAVPGSYRVNQPVIRISSFHPTLRVVDSKQHPRKALLQGSDGKEYTFLLKGREDLRQDERVMQLLRLVNAMLANDRATNAHDLSITRYAVIPLSPTTGLIEWVPHCDTIHAVVKQYRDCRNILPNIEQKLIVKAAPDYRLLTVLQKAEVFQYALSMTSGQDLSKVLWLKSPRADVWLLRRANYTRSLAVMSMVGYILGLGDRHPCNLMLERHSGKVVHIDFGDCFEVAMRRDRYPEKVPFRLTRMLINAMEVSGIEGTFRSTCEKVMKVLRNNKNSVIAVLEAFAYDPLMDWKLIGEEISGVCDVDDGEEEPPAKRLSNTLVNPITEKTGIIEEEETVDNRPPTARIDASKLRRGSTVVEEVLNKKAMSVIARVVSKLNGTDFDEFGNFPSEDVELEDAKMTTSSNLAQLRDKEVRTKLGYAEQVDRLIEQATSHENLCQAYIGWCPFW